VRTRERVPQVRAVAKRKDARIGGKKKGKKEGPEPYTASALAEGGKKKALPRKRPGRSKKGIDRVRSGGEKKKRRGGR